jgi:hypothetical protein
MVLSTNMISRSSNTSKRRVTLRNGVTSLRQVVWNIETPIRQKKSDALERQWETKNEMNMRLGTSMEIGCYTTASGKLQSRGNIPK